MYQHLMTVYEAKQKELLVENNELRTSLAHIHRDISKALGLSDHLTSHSAKVPFLLCSNKTFSTLKNSQIHVYNWYNQLTLL